MNQWNELKPNEIGDSLLCEWALWNRDGHGGVSSSEGYLRERLDQAHDGNPPDEVERTEKILAKLRLEGWFQTHWRVIKHYYLGGKSVEETYRSIERTEGFTRLLLKEVTDMIADRVRGLTEVA